jgi:hypothetical protein
MGRIRRGDCGVAVWGPEDGAKVTVRSVRDTARERELDARRPNWRDEPLDWLCEAAGPIRSVLVTREGGRRNVEILKGKR